MNVLEHCAWLKLYREHEGDLDHTEADDAEAKRRTERLRRRLKTWRRRAYQDPRSGVYDQVANGVHAVAGCAKP